MTRRVIEVKLSDNRFELIDNRGKIEKWLPYCAIIVSILAVGVAVMGGYHSRQHSKLSVRPSVDFVYHLERSHDRPGLYLTNSGLGPARIQQIGVKFDGNKVEQWSEITSKVKKEDAVPWVKHAPIWAEIGPGTLIEEGTKLGLHYTFRENVKDYEAFARLYEQRIAVNVRFCSMYDECWESNTPTQRSE